jgi:uncharacterized phage-associated protein
MQEIEFNEEKFRELILYIASECSDDVFWGATKLNKQLFFCDFLAFQQLGQPITGAEYMALDYGPVPRRMLPTRAQMLLDGDIIIETRAFQKRIVALRTADLSQFSSEEIHLVKDVVEQLRESSADEVSELSHRFIGWKAAIAEGQAKGENIAIPYGTVFVSRPTLTEEENAETLEMARKHEWPV